MDSFEINKIVGAILGTCLGLLALNIAAGAVFTPHKPAKAGYEVAVLEPKKGKGEPQPAEEPIEKLLASADVGRGETSSKKCLACHTFDKGGQSRVGPNLWGIVGRQRAAVPDFKYSPAMKSHPGNWTIAELNTYLQNPRGMIPGTNMSFAGIPRASERADLISYLNTLADNPAPLPKAAEGPSGTKSQ